MNFQTPYNQTNENKTLKNIYKKDELSNTVQSNKQK